MRSTRSPRITALAGHVAFVENYDIHAAHFFTQGVDAWLNNPRPPLEACGTSGQKAGMNGVLNVSVLDGWWYEGHNGNNGWAIGEFAGRPRGPVRMTRRTPNRCIACLKNRSFRSTMIAIRTGFRTAGFGWRRNPLRSIVPRFSASRMLKEYTTRMYVRRVRVFLI